MKSIVRPVPLLLLLSVVALILAYKAFDYGGAVTFLGATFVLGTAIGYNIARQTAQPRYVTYGTQEVCSTVQDTHEEERISGYRVRYEYLGQRYSTITRNPPGNTVRVRVDVTPAF